MLEVTLTELNISLTNLWANKFPVNPVTPITKSNVSKCFLMVFFFSTNLTEFCLNSNKYICTKESSFVHLYQKKGYLLNSNKAEK